MNQAGFNGMSQKRVLIIAQLGVVRFQEIYHLPGILVTNKTTIRGAVPTSSGAFSFFFSQKGTHHTSKKPKKYTHRLTQQNVSKARFDSHFFVAPYFVYTRNDLCFLGGFFRFVIGMQNGTCYLLSRRPNFFGEVPLDSMIFSPGLQTPQREIGMRSMGIRSVMTSKNACDKLRQIQPFFKPTIVSKYQVIQVMTF